jgi:Domain of unknown function (DUF4399)/FMRFamide related peptide family
VCLGNDFFRRQRSQFLRFGTAKSPHRRLFNANLKESPMRLSLLTIALLSIFAVAHAGETPAPADAKVYFINLKDGDTLTSPVTIRFGLSGMGIAPAGTQVPNTGHHHLLIDAAPLEGEALNEAIPMDEHHMHFGKGQTEAVVTLPKGSHTLQLVLGDWSHIPHKDPVMSERITVNVE